MRNNRTVQNEAEQTAQAGTMVQCGAVQTELKAKRERTQRRAEHNGAVQVQCSAVQCSAVRCSAVQCSLHGLQCSAMQCSLVQCSRMLNALVRCSAVDYSAVQSSAKARRTEQNKRHLAWQAWL
jgi:hypothetical protein